MIRVTPDLAVSAPRANESLSDDVTAIWGLWAGEELLQHLLAQVGRALRGGAHPRRAAQRHAVRSTSCKPHQPRFIEQRARVLLATESPAGSTTLC